MSQAPYMLRKARLGGYHYGHGTMEDAALHDGLWCAANHGHVGLCVEHVVHEMGISREEQDRYTISSYQRAADAWQRGAMDAEVVPVRVKNPAPRESMESRTLVVATDEEYSRLRMDDVATLPPVFQEGGTITAASASSLNDGAAAIVLVSAERANDLGLRAMARVVAFADHGVEPANFACAPSGSVRRALSAAGMTSVN